MRQITLTRVSRVRRYPVTFNARPVEQRRRRGFHPATHAFFVRLGGAVAALLFIIPMFYYMAKTYG